MTLSFTNDIGILASATTISGAMDEADKMQTTGSDNAYEAAMWRSISLTHVEYPKGLCLGHTYLFTLRATSVKLHIHCVQNIRRFLYHNIAITSHSNTLHIIMIRDSVQ